MGDSPTPSKNKQANNADVRDSDDVIAFLRYPCAVNTNWGVGLFDTGCPDLSLGTPRTDDVQAEPAGTTDAVCGAAAAAAALGQFYEMTITRQDAEPEKMRRT